MNCNFEVLTFFQRSKNILKDSKSFILWGFLLTVFLPFFPDNTGLKLQEVLKESIALNSISFLLLAELFGFSIYITIFDNYRDNEREIKKRIERLIEKSDSIIFDSLVNSPARFIYNFLPAYFGILIGFSISTVFHGQFNYLPGILAAFVAMQLVIFLSNVFPSIFSYEKKKPYSKHILRIIGFILVTFIVIIVSTGFLENL